MAPVIIETRAKLLARREEILRDLGMTLDDFRASAETMTLTSEELDLLDELEEIDFLVGDAA